MMIDAPAPPVWAPAFWLIKIGLRWQHHAGVVFHSQESTHCLPWQDQTTGGSGSKPLEFCGRGNCGHLPRLYTSEWGITRVPSALFSIRSQDGHAEGLRGQVGSKPGGVVGNRDAA